MGALKKEGKDLELHKAGQLAKFPNQTTHSKLQLPREFLQMPGDVGIFDMEKYGKEMRLRAVESKKQCYYFAREL